MALSKSLACTVCALAIVTAACADGTGNALTPTLPTPDANVTNPDGTRLKASAPEPSTPRGAARTSSLTPQLQLANAATTFQPGTLEYEFEVYDGSTLVAQAGGIAPANASSTMWTVPANILKLNKTYTWRGRATHNGVDGSWSEMVTFLTPLPAATASSSGGGPVPCGGNTGHDIIRCVAAAYPERLVKTSTGNFSDERRAENMEFLRDRIIETGICRGLDLGQNYKRGTPVISKDFVVLRGQGHDRGVDIARGYDNTSNHLQLTWQVFDRDKNYGHPYFKNYGPVDCSGVN